MDPDALSVPDRPAVFLDRDGTLIEDPGYPEGAEQVRLLPGVADALLAIERAGYLRIVITNQSGIGRGKVSQAGYQATEVEVARQLRDSGASIDATYHCPHTPEAGCTCRKPGTALHREAIAVFGIDPLRSWFIGDRLRDVAPAAELGGRAILLDPSGQSEESGAAEALGAAIVPDLVAGVTLLPRYT